MTRQVRQAINYIACLFLLTLLQNLTTAVGSQESVQPQTLELGRPIERTIAGGESHVYQLSLTSGQFVRIVIDQRGADVSEVVTGPDGQKVVEVDGPVGSQGAEPVLYVAVAPGMHQLQVRVLNRNAPSGRYEIKIEVLRDATDRDRDAVAAQKAFMEGVQLTRGDATAESRRRGIAKVEESISLWRSAGDQSGEALSLHILGGLHGASGDPIKALEFLNQALSIRRAIGDRRGEASTLNNIAGAYLLLGEYQKVVDSLMAALELQRSIGDQNGEALVLNNSCLANRRLGEYQKALDQCNQALALQRQLGNKRLEAENLNNIGLVYKSLEQYQDALNFYKQSLALKRALIDRRSSMSTLGNMGEVYRLLGDWQTSLTHFGEALEISRELSDLRVQSVTLGNLGSVHASSGDQQKALDYFSQALLLRQKITDRAGEAILRSSIARAQRDLGNLTDAQSQVETATSIIESIRTGVLNQELRDSYFGTVQDIYELYVDILFRRHKQEPDKGFDANALVVSERARARGLLDILGEAGTDIRYGVDSKLLERERSLASILNAKAASQVRLLSGKHTPAQAEAIAKEIAAVTTDYEQVRAQIRTASPRYAALTEPSPLSVKEIQAQLLDDETLMLEFLLGRERSYLWAVTRNSLTTFELPGRAKIESVAQNLVAALRVSHERQHRREAENAIAELSQLILGPVAERLRAKRLLVVADGILQYIPFAALVAPKDSAPLVESHEVVSLPSVSVLAVLRREQMARKPVDKMIAVLADPVMQGDDPRLVQNAQVSSKGSKRELRGLEDTEVASLSRLPFSRREAEAILALSKTPGNLKALDFEANRKTAISPQLSDYRIVHFATHGLITSRYPHLSGLVLSLVDEKGQYQDGFVRLHDIYNLKFGADLIVLSACKSALGKQIRGEGLVGLVRGFMYAGAPRVVASLWDVKDEATAELMKRFYEKMLVEKQSPAAALRAAQVSLRKDSRWRAPYYWAGFTIQGEWK